MTQQVSSPDAASSTASPAATTSAKPAATAAPYLARGTPDYWRASGALIAAGFATFSLLYCVQPLLPLFSRDFNVSPVAASLSVSIATGLLALAIFVGGLFSESLNRRQIMVWGMGGASVLTLLSAWMPTWGAFLTVRGLEGIMLGGVPAVAMAYISEEVDPAGLGLSMGLYVGGTAIGGMLGRVVTGVLTDLFSWRVAIAGIGLFGIVATLIFYLLLPPSRRFVPRRGLGFARHRDALAGHLRQPRMLALFLTGMLLMGAFVTIYNYVGYRLLAPPYALRQSQIALIFLTYLIGSVASPASGKLADQLGRGWVLGGSVGLMGVGLALTLMTPLVGVIAGIVVFTIGFFGGHSVASGWVGFLSTHAKGQAAALYLLAYYVGSSILGSLGGHFWVLDAWRGVCGMVGVLLALALGLAIWLTRATIAAHAAAASNN
ncbi:MAG: MFS transporter [Janthinobacterium lividum]